jgi:serine protease Do
MRRIILPLILLAAAAQKAEARQTGTLTPRARIYTSNRSEDGDRAMLGVSTASSGKRDTLGLLIESVTPGSPADKAGLEEGNRIVSINGISLKLAREDAGEPDMSGTMTNRLMREMRKLKAGDEASLEVWTGARLKSVKVKTVAARDLTPERLTREEAEDRAALGIMLGSSGSKRDTLGVFVSGVTENGPADKAGISEGDRIASINGVDLRVPREDIGDWSVANARVARLEREIHKLKPGASVELSVVEGGRAKSIKVTLGRAKDLERNNGFSFTTGDGESFFKMPHPPMPPMSPMEPMSPMAPMPPHAKVRVFGGDGNQDWNLDGLGESLRASLRESLRDIGPRAREQLDLELPRLRDELDRELPRIRDDLDRELPRIHDELEREIPRVMDDVRSGMDRLRLEVPLIRARLGRRVII